MYQKEEIVSIYDEKYSDIYNRYYLIPWIEKHKFNIKNITEILETIPYKEKRWLDLCCGQGWHFSQFPSAIKKIGIDLSRSQLKRAKDNNSDAIFIQADVLEIVFKRNEFNLVTNFWAAYCYLNSTSKIKLLLRRAIEWTQKGGAIYFEILLPEYLKSFNQSQYSRQTGFQIIPKSADFTKWSYQDSGGIHNMTSPPLALFENMISQSFQTVHIKHDNGFMTHVIGITKQ